jgi:hypothetical protein
MTYNAKNKENFLRRMIDPKKILMDGKTMISDISKGGRR